MQIRQATPEDSLKISSLLIDLSRRYIVADFGANAAEMLLSSMKPESIKQYITQGYQYHVTEQQGLIVGVIGMKENKHLYHLFVADECRGKGVASQLWQVAKQHCLDTGNNGYFTVNSALSAQSVYLKWGFKALQGRRERNGVIDVPMELIL